MTNNELEEKLKNKSIVQLRRMIGQRQDMIDKLLSIRGFDGSVIILNEATNRYFIHNTANSINHYQQEIDRIENKIRLIEQQFLLGILGIMIIGIIAQMNKSRE